MKVKILLSTFLFLVFMLFFSCDTTEPGGDIPKPPGYQEDISWASLADSPWPMHHGNPQSNGRSKYPGPMLGQRIDWGVDSLFLTSSLVVDEENNIYTYSAGSKYYGFNSFDINGNHNWRIKSDSVNLGYEASTPLIGSDGTIYIASGLIVPPKLCAFDKDGNIKWVFEPDGGKHLEILGINIGLDGTIYFLDKADYLYAVSKNGTLKWKFYYSDFGPRGYPVLTFSPDGKTLYIPGNNKSVYAFDIESQQIKWSFGDIITAPAPMVDSQGNIYLLTKKNDVNDGKASLFSLKENGEIRWVYTHNNESVDYHYVGTGTIDKNGNIYFALDTLYSINYSGELNWKKDLDGKSLSPLVSDINNNVYITISRYPDVLYTSYDINGNINWQLSRGENAIQGSSPCLLENKIIFPTSNWYDELYLIK